MAFLHGGALLCGLVVRKRVSATTLVLVFGVTAWWLMILGTTLSTVPTNALAGDPGRSAHLHAPPLTQWQIPVGRFDFDAYNLAVDADDELAIAKVTTVAEW